VSWVELVFFAPVLVGLLLCIRAVISRDSRGWRLAAVAFAFLPDFIPLVARIWVRWTHAPAGTRDTIFPDATMLAPVVPAAFLLVWAVRTSDARGLRVASAILGLLSLVPVIFSWYYFAGAFR
jgi:hypothetical protein